MAFGRFCLCFDLLHISVGESGCRRSGVVLGKSGIEGGEALAVDACCCGVSGRKKSGAGKEIGAWVEKLFGREMQKGSVLAVHLEKSDADGDAPGEKPVSPRHRLFERSHHRPVAHSPLGLNGNGEWFATATSAKSSGGQIGL